ncbi:MAG: serine hydrolase domain-containing protein [Pseudomonadota bacterium]
MRQLSNHVSRRSILAAATASAAATVLSGCGGQAPKAFEATAQVPPSSSNAAAISNARESAWKAIGSGQGSGVSVAIMAGREFVLSEGIGVADRAHNRLVDRQTRFNIGSVSKMFVTVAILLLVDEGKVALDAYVVRYLPEFTMMDARFSDITLRMLLNHSSGLPGTTAFIGFEPDPTVHQLLLDTLKRSRLKHAPGAMSMYCNDGFTLAEMVVEQVTGRKFVAFLGERVFAPLGMNNTATSLGESGGANVAEYYDAISGKKYPREVVPIYAAGGFSSTAEDLCRFGDSLMAGGRNLLSTASLQELYRSQPAPFTSGLREGKWYGQVGWDYSTQIGSVGGSSGIQVFAKGGNSGLYSANLQIFPTEKMVVAMITSGKASGDKLTEPILAGVLTDRQPGVPVHSLAQPRVAQAIPAALDRYVGHYASETGTLKIAIDSQRRKLIVTPLVGAAPPEELIYNDDYFFVPTGERRVYFASRDGIDFLVKNEGGLTDSDEVTLQKLEPVLNPQRLQSALSNGFWLIRNAPASVEVFDFDLIQTLKSYEELPGYVDFRGVRRIERPDFAAMAATAIRDQSDLDFVEGKGGGFMRTGHYLWSPARTAGRLPQAPSTVTIGADGFNEWRAVEAGGLLNFKLPAKGRVIVVTEGTTLYDSIVDSGAVHAPPGSYVFFAGATGDVFQVIVR